MTYIGQLPSTQLSGTLIPFFRLRFTELCSDWSKRYFCVSRTFCEFYKSDISFNHSLKSVYLDKLYLVKKQ